MENNNHTVVFDGCSFYVIPSLDEPNLSEDIEIVRRFLCIEKAQEFADEQNEEL